MSFCHRRRVSVRNCFAGDAHQFDPWVGLAVGAYIGWSGFELIQDTVSPLLGQAPDPKLVKHIRDKIMSYPGVLGVHDLMVHDYGPGRKFASAHAEMAAEASPLGKSRHARQY